MRWPAGDGRVGDFFRRGSRHGGLGGQPDAGVRVGERGADGALGHWQPVGEREQREVARQAAGARVARPARPPSGRLPQGGGSDVLPRPRPG